MFEYRYGKIIPDDKVAYFRCKLIEEFAEEYDINSNRLWNCLRERPKCIEFEELKRLNIPEEICIYLERHNEVYITTFDEVCRYVDELEPWEYIDAYVFDGSFGWLVAITHEELKCLIVGL